MEIKLYIRKIENLHSKSRENERYAADLLIKEVFGNEASIGHEDSGKPFLKKNDIRQNIEISISHTKGAIVLAMADYPIGIDIEYISDRAFRLREKFMNNDEIHISENNKFLDKVTSALAIWCVKEAAFKKIGSGASDFKATLNTTSIGINYIDIQYNNKNISRKYTFNYQLDEEKIIVYG